MTVSQFGKIDALGYPRLVPVIPPDAEISEGSSLYKRIGTKQDARGKVPGVKGSNGRWFSFDWVPHVADAYDLERWHDMQAGTGIKTGHGLYAIDADTMDPDSADIIKRKVVEHFGETSVRVGRAPKALYLVRTSAPVLYMRVEFGPLDPETQKPTERCEILGDRKFFVAEGIHPKTRAPYQWPVPLRPFQDLPETTPEAIEAFLADLKTLLPNAALPKPEGAGDDVNQDTLTGKPEVIRDAVSKTPNTSQHFPSRETYLAMGYAIKAALPDDEHEAFEIFNEWCDRWAEGRNEPDIIASDWRRMQPPYRRGAPWIYEQAETLSQGQFSQAAVHFEPIKEAPKDPFDIQADREREERAETDAYDLLTASALMGREPPTFLIDRHIPDVSTGFLYSAPGVGKSFLALDMALAIAHGFKDWHGDPINTPEDKRQVVYIASEGSFDLGNRIRAWVKARGINQISDNFLVIEQTIDFMRADDINKLTRTIYTADVNPAMVFVDTVSRSMPGADENLQKEMTLFVKACDHVKETFRCAVMGIHHAGKAGDMRGSTVLKGAGDFVIQMIRAKGSNVATLTMEKQKAAEDGWDCEILMDQIDLGDGHSSLVINRPLARVAAAGEDGKHAPTLGATSPERAILLAIQKAWDAKEPWSMARNAAAGRRAVRGAVVATGLRAVDAEKMLVAMTARGWLEVAVCDSASKRKGLSVGVGAWAALSAAEADTPSTDAEIAAHFEPVNEMDTMSGTPQNEQAFG